MVDHVLWRHGGYKQCLHIHMLCRCLIPPLGSFQQQHLYHRQWICVRTSASSVSGRKNAIVNKSFGLQGAEIEHVLKSVMRKQVMVGKQAVLDLASQAQVPRSVPS